MLKHILFAGSVMIASPVFAQTAGTATPTQATSPATAAPTVSTAPTGDAITAQTSPASPAPIAPADPVVAQGNPVPATPEAAAGPAAGASQVEQIVGREFGAYDKNKDGKLSPAEFDGWMVALKTASDPTTKADAPETRKWLGAAFAQADVDKSRDLTQEELTGFLSQGQS